LRWEPARQGVSLFNAGANLICLYVSEEREGGVTDVVGTFHRLFLRDRFDSYIDDFLTKWQVECSLSM